MRGRGDRVDPRSGRKAIHWMTSDERRRDLGCLRRAVANAVGRECGTSSRCCNVMSIFDEQDMDKSMNAKMKLLSKMPIRERDELDVAIQKVMDDAVRRGLLEPLGLDSDGKMVYRRTTKRGDVA